MRVRMEGGRREGRKKKSCEVVGRDRVCRCGRRQEVPSCWRDRDECSHGVRVERCVTTLSWRSSEREKER